MKESFGQRLKKLREDKNMSQEELAIALGKSGKHIRNVISNWEKDRAEPSLSDLNKLCEVLETTPNFLLNGDQTKAAFEPPAGYVVMKADEVIELQRQLLQKQKEKIEEQK
ncbi:helix-turn-helix domain-containing protein [Larkinella sp. C7]|uniref:helix-turn-helix domain-containing protein n=1 Tax=Larkinella sp. C7 TaxID=2576607 RepID=UPI001111173C|nr:helix-turn-helix transcriptional regulator [Larkinella sp. C7]